MRLPGVNVGIFCTTPAVGVARNIAAQARDGNAADRRDDRCPDGARLGAGQPGRVATSELDAAIARFTGIICNRSASVVALGKRAFYRQVDRDIAGAYALAGGVMAGNMLDPDAHEGIDAFLAKQPPKWSG